MQVRSILMVIAVCATSLSCSPRKTPRPLDRVVKTVETQGVRAVVSVPEGEAQSLGTYAVMVHFSDAQVQRLTARREGSVSNAWLANLVGDDTLDLIVAFASVGSGSYGSVAVHELQGDRFVLRSLRPISPEQRDGYGGHDVFTVKDGRLWRTYPRYLPSDTNAEPTGGSMRLWYAFDEDLWMEDRGN
jgi:hypothetical protein